MAAAAPASATDPSIVVGSHNLLPNTPHQPIAIRVAGVSSVGMLNLNAQIDAGTNYPVFDGVDLTTGTIFAANHQDPIDIGSTPYLATRSIMTASGRISSPSSSSPPQPFSSVAENHEPYSVFLRATPW